MRAKSHQYQNKFFGFTCGSFRVVADIKVKFYGHNCFLLTGSESCVLTDPWLSRNGAFFGSWFQWPVNHDLLAPLIDDLKTRGSVTLYISHEHQDHFDVATLNRAVCSNPTP